ncbi:MAG: RidA family protein [Candidatus Methanomethylophilaceae archaeon]|nr:RidA family protein [Candidatus Methanomethylophilaceae archaeon]MBR7123858.1 RidA family protein [Candidatus Methanomethylophilaceae archaeon]
MRSVSTGSAPAAIGPYSQAVECNGMVFVSGQLPVDPMTGEMPDTPAEQARRALENVRAIVESSGCTMADCVKVTIYLTDLSAFVQVNEVYKEFFAEPYPARSCIEVSAVPKGAMLEIDAIAIRSS